MYALLRESEREEAAYAQSASLACAPTHYGRCGVGPASCGIREIRHQPCLLYYRCSKSTISSTQWVKMIRRLLRNVLPSCKNPKFSFSIFSDRFSELPGVFFSFKNEMRTHPSGLCALNTPERKHGEMRLTEISFL